MNLHSIITWPKCLGKVGWLDFLVGFPPQAGSFFHIFFRRAAFQSGCLSQEKSLGRAACWRQQGWSWTQGGGGAGGGGGGEGGGRGEWRGGRRFKWESLGGGGAGAQPSSLHPSSSLPPSSPFPAEHKLCPRRGRSETSTMSCHDSLLRTLTPTTWRLTLMAPSPGWALTSTPPTTPCLRRCSGKKGL